MGVVTCPWCSYSMPCQHRGRKTTVPGHPPCQSRGLSKITKSQATQTSCLARAQHKLSRITTREGCLDSPSLCKKQLSPAVSTLEKQTPNIGSSKEQMRAMSQLGNAPWAPPTQHNTEESCPAAHLPGTASEVQKGSDAGTLWDTGHVLQLERRVSYNTILGCGI